MQPFFFLFFLSSGRGGWEGECMIRFGEFLGRGKQRGGGEENGG